jgi:hypothetical protein
VKIRKILISAGCLSFLLAPMIPSASGTGIKEVSLYSILSSGVEINASTVYNNTELEQYGLSKEAFNYAWTGYQKILASGKISNERFLTICDFSQSSKHRRLYIIDIAAEKLLINTWVAHGKNSGSEYATSFSNKNESLQSSLGFYITASTYVGNNGLSLKLNGLEPGFNSNALERTIVIHGADYVDGARVNAGYYMGRSWGCPAVPKKEAAQIIQTIKNGTCLFVYHPSKDYLQHSKILND